LGEEVLQVFQGFGRDLIPFFLNIRFNNNRAFMDAHKAEYRAVVRDPFYAWIEAIAPALLAIDPNMEVRPAKCLSRVYRDTRFSKDKSPYRDHHWVSFRQAAEAKEGALFYWFEISPEHISWGLGLWGENRTVMDALRRRMAAKPDEFLALLPDLETGGFTLGGDTFKRLPLPAGLPNKLNTWYIRKSLYIEKSGIDIGRIYSPGIVTDVAADYQTLLPWYRLLRGFADIGAAEEQVV
jgi:uncharacterized protein (TIGR02453 family)